MKHVLKQILRSVLPKSRPQAVVLAVFGVMIFTSLAVLGQTGLKTAGSPSAGDETTVAAPTGRWGNEHSGEAKSDAAVKKPPEKTADAEAADESAAAGAAGPEVSRNTTAVQPVPPAPPTHHSNPLAGWRFYVNPDSPAGRQAATWRAERPGDAASMKLLGAQPTAGWFGGWNGDVTGEVAQLAAQAAGAGRAAVVVAYNIPQRDCGGYSAGGTGAAGYRSWIDKLAAGLGSSRAVVILEPDALAHTSCLSGSELEQRYNLLRYAVSTLKGRTSAKVYIDAGHARWLAAGEVARRLKLAGIEGADGFSLNVSNFVATTESVRYGQQVAGLVNKGFVVDTSRNGAGPAAGNAWCNPSGRAVGNLPTSNTGSRAAHAFLWIKVPGESDGECAGGPPAGVWWAEYALGLARRAGY